MSLKLAARLVALMPTKIADIQENDTTAHELDLSATLPKECMAILIRPILSAGAGAFQVYPMGDAAYITLSSTLINIVTIKERILKWSNSVANDDWDLWIYGYFTQKRTR